MFGNVVPGYAAGRRFADSVVMGICVIRFMARMGRMGAFSYWGAYTGAAWGFR